MKKGFWAKYHKWAGLLFCFFILVFCFSGIVLNHRQLFSGCEVGRWWLPSDYHYDNWNNGIVKGTFKTADGRILAYGNAGVWLTDSCFSSFTPMNDGLDEGIDNRKISNIARTKDGNLWCAGLYAAYKMEGMGEKNTRGNHWQKLHWQKISLGEDAGRISDITAHGDSIVVVSRSFVYTALTKDLKFTRHELKTPNGYEPKVTLFRTIWLLHSGELFGLTGRLVVDFIALAIIVLCFTGLIYTFVPPIMKHKARAKKQVKGYAKTLKFSTKWHNRLGYYLIILTVLLAFTGACLRPPLMIPFALTSTKPLPGSSLSSDNAFNDKLRALRYDERIGKWLLASSIGFYEMEDFDAVPRLKDNAPTISPMGINTFERADSKEWLVGSFSGLFRWNPETDKVVDYFTGKAPEQKHGMAFSGHAVSGFSQDLAFGDAVVFEYSEGAKILYSSAKDTSISAKDTSTSVKGASISDKLLPPMPEVLVEQPMSLWNFALELHVGRCYSPFLGPVSALFVFLSGTILTLILVSGLIVYRRQRKKQGK